MLRSARRKSLHIVAPWRRNFSALRLCFDNTLISTLHKDPESDANFPNQRERAVRDGHWVEVAPMPLHSPKLLAHSEDMVRRLGLSKEHVRSEGFLRVFSGGATEYSSWATGTLLELVASGLNVDFGVMQVAGNPIVGDRFQGDGYGDGRAISIGEVVNGEERWELQLKGGGRTPFSRGFDGRAVLRSSIREFLVQEAMHWLGVPTTRSVSLVMSETEEVHRAWYGEEEAPTRNSFPPNSLVTEPCAITTRTSSSFLRVGHLELFARRIGKSQVAQSRLEDLLRYALKREFPEVNMEMEKLTKKAIVEMVEVFAQRQARLVNEWIRVGYVQGNMNSDNCLLCGRTMDYGPFGFVEQYHPLWSPFTSDPARNFGFERQPVEWLCYVYFSAAHIQLVTLANALVPLLKDCEDSMKELKRVVEEVYAEKYLATRDEMRRRKLGLSEWTEADDKELWEPLHKILQDFDYTIFFRQLSTGFMPQDTQLNDSELLSPLIPACYNENLDEETASEEYAAVVAWIKKWMSRADLVKNQETMLQVNPKYVPREWMLHEAYTRAEDGDYSVLEDLQQLFLEPYAEQPHHHAKYYQRTPTAMKDKPGIAFYS